MHVGFDMSQLNQDDEWMVGDVDLLSKFDQFKNQSIIPRFSLSLDGIADVSQGSDFYLFLSSEERRLATAVSPSSVDDRWPNLKGIMERERKNHGRDLFVEIEEQALMADGVALFGDHQIYLAETSLIYDPKLEKQVKDKFKLFRCMRDSWNSQIRSIAREAMPPTGLSVFGSTSFGDETKFYAMDFAGTYR
ncbi:hypothetical protein BGZ72_000659, partial [Mortierella alpina]